MNKPQKTHKNLEKNDENEKKNKQRQNTNLRKKCYENTIELLRVKTLSENKIKVFNLYPSNRKCVICKKDCGEVIPK